MVRGCPQGRTNWTARRSDLGRFVPMRTQGALAGLTMLVVVLAGCTGTAPDPMPATQVATTTPSPSPAPSPTADEFDASVLPVAPPGLSGPPSQDAAGEVAKYFLSQFPYMQATGDYSRWDALTGHPCKYCVNGRAIAKRIIEAGHHSVGGELEFLRVDVHDYAPDEYAVLVWFVEHASRVVDGRGNLVEDFPGSTTGSADMHVSWRDDGWRIDTVTVDIYKEEDA